jgi:hypothetical protein
MREGAWIEARSGRWVWISEHANWMQQHGPEVGLPSDVWERIRKIPNDYIGPNREKILRAVMDAGYIRARGHGASISFEFTCSTRNALIACRDFLHNVAGARLHCRFTNLGGGPCLELPYSEYLEIDPEKYG